MPAARALAVARGGLDVDEDGVPASEYEAPLCDGPKDPCRLDCLPRAAGLYVDTVPGPNVVLDEATETASFAMYCGMAGSAPIALESLDETASDDD